MNQNNYMISAHRKKDIVVMIMGIIGGVLLLFGPFFNFATLHFRVNVDGSIGSYVVSLVSGGDTGITLKDMEANVDYGLDMFEMQKLGSNLTEFGKITPAEKSDIKTANKEVEDFVRYDLGLEDMGIDVNADVYDELFGIMGTSAYAYDALCIVPYALIVLGCLIILFSALKKGLIALVCSVIASGGMAWVMLGTDRPLEIMGIGMIVIAAGLLISIISSLSGTIMRSRWRKQK